MTKTSVETLHKGPIVNEIASIQFQMVQSIYSKGEQWNITRFPFVYLDLTAGQGIYPGCEGIALTLNRELQKQSFPKKTFLIDVSEENCQRLRETPFDGNVRICPGTHHDIAPQIIREECAHRPFGIVCLDPYGFGETEATLLRKIGFSPELERMDWLIHISGTSIKRVNGCSKTIFKGDFQDVLGLIDKKRWLIKQSPVGKRQQWVYLFGTNYQEMGEWKKKAWHNIKSPEGHSILRKIQYTSEQFEILSQPMLFEEDEEVA